MLPGFLGQAQADFEKITSGDFSEVATISDGAETIQIPCLFDDAYATFDTESQSSVVRPESRIMVAETATQFNLRRGGLLVTIRGRTYKVRTSDWEFDGLGALTLYLDKTNP